MSFYTRPLLRRLSLVAMTVEEGRRTFPEAEKYVLDCLFFVGVKAHGVPIHLIPTYRKRILRSYQRKLRETLNPMQVLDMEINELR